MADIIQLSAYRKQVATASKKPRRLRKPKQDRPDVSINAAIGIAAAVSFRCKELFELEHETSLSLAREIAALILRHANGGSHV